MDAFPLCVSYLLIRCRYYLKYSPLVNVTLFFRRAIVAAFSTEQIYKTLSKTDFILQLVNRITAKNY